MKMKNLPSKKACIRNPKAICFLLDKDKCEFLDETACLRQALYLAQNEVAIFKQKRNLKHSKISIKWRDSSNYYKKRCIALQEFIKVNGLQIPTVAESSHDPDLNIIVEDTKGEENHELDDSNSAHGTIRE